MILYLTIAISFAIMYHMRYIHQAFEIVDEMYQISKVKTTRYYNPIVISLAYLATNIILMPIYVTQTLIFSRHKIISSITDGLLKNYFEIQK